ncbi:hypothetical protein, partial [Escherichia coli]|uniref:hypothetical protein n=1 Tax=Escherichia coli TaxID=562 RepID=UPI00201F4A17
MHRIDTKTAQKDKFGAGKNGFTRGNPQTGTPATDLDDDYFDMLQEELCSVVEASGASLEKGRHDQLLTALRALLLSRKNPFGDIKSDGTVKTALENLGLRDAVTGTESMLRIPAFINGQPGTYVIQTQTLTSNTSSGLIVFPEAFNNKCMIIIAVDYAAAAVDNSRVRFNIPTKSQCEWFGQTMSVNPTPVSPS